MDTSLRFRWLGAAGLELTAGEHTLAIDPYFTRISLRSACFGRVCPDSVLIAEKIERCDFVLITHAHFDHLMDVPDVVSNTGATALGSPNSCRLLSACGVPGDRIRGIRAGDALELGGLSVEVREARHLKAPGFSPGSLPKVLDPPLRARDYRMDDDFSFLISAGGLGLLTDPGEIPEGAAPADVLFVFPFRMDSFYEALLPLVQPRLVVPVHWDDFFRPLTKPLRPSFRPPRKTFPPVKRIDLAAFARLVGRILPEARVLQPEIFRTYDLAELT
jgi:L-ascorbate metabolism protein UlaG (beta-lactamase superfamily)